MEKLTQSRQANAAAIFVVLALASCTTPATTPYDPAGAPLANYTSEEAASITRAYSSREAAVQFLSNTTVMSAGGGHGTQIEFLAANGTTSLWYPRNSTAVAGHWKVVETEAGVPIICFLYGTNSYNPVTRKSGGSWECSETMQLYLMRANQIASGDPFGLATGRIPFVMPTEDEAKRAITFGAAKEIGDPSLSRIRVSYKVNQFSIE